MKSGECFAGFLPQAPHLKKHMRYICGGCFGFMGFLARQNAAQIPSGSILGAHFVSWVFYKQCLFVFYGAFSFSDSASFCGIPDRSFMVFLLTPGVCVSACFRLPDL